ncbi:GNAT family N-acetyltransferase [Eupransor demetentiae]|uniref:RimJ/RimL family (RimL) n=1 Tax=Eupransor demetentiae TaxID=3109584 RepID=A0ABM9N455_9LACO|nr:Protein N-acetyltransferase [Lactobacillaceae bacterium LMG 33000]
MFPYQINDKITLKLPQPQNDAPALFHLIDSSRKEMLPWLPWVEKMTNEHEEADFLISVLKQTALQKALHTVIHYEHKPVGMLSFNTLDHEKHSAEIGYWLGTRYTSMGIMHTAVEALCRIGFEHYQLDTIEIHAASDNLASNHVAEKAGFQLVEVRPNQEDLPDGHHDQNIWLLNK